MKSLSDVQREIEAEIENAAQEIAIYKQDVLFHVIQAFSARKAKDETTTLFHLKRACDAEYELRGECEVVGALVEEWYPEAVDDDEFWIRLEAFGDERDIAAKQEDRSIQEQVRAIELDTERTRQEQRSRSIAALIKWCEAGGTFQMERDLLVSDQGQWIVQLFKPGKIITCRKFDPDDALANAAQVAETSI